MRFLVSSDWHLSPESPAGDARLAAGFLARARAEGATAVLAGDVFDDLFAGRDRCRRSHPGVVAAMDALERDGRLLRVRGNHDPDAGAARLVLDVPGLGRILVAHGHEADPINAGPLGRAGDAISRRLGRTSLVRAAARWAEAASRGLAEERMIAVFRRRCLALVARERCVLGVFGHVHVAHLAPGDPYVNTGALARGTLTCVALDRAGPRLLTLRAGELPDPRDGIGLEMG